MCVRECVSENSMLNFYVDATGPLGHWIKRNNEAAELNFSPEFPLKSFKYALYGEGKRTRQSRTLVTHFEAEQSKCSIALSKRFKAYIVSE